MNWNERYSVRADNGNVDSALKRYYKNRDRADDNNPDHHDILGNLAKIVSTTAYHEKEFNLAKEFKVRRENHEKKAKELRDGIQGTFF